MNRSARTRKKMLRRRARWQQGEAANALEGMRRSLGSLRVSDERLERYVKRRAMALFGPQTTLSVERTILAFFQQHIAGARHAARRSYAFWAVISLSRCPLHCVSLSAEFRSSARCFEYFSHLLTVLLRLLVVARDLSLLGNGSSPAIWNPAVRPRKRLPLELHNAYRPEVRPAC